ncbi:NmrA family protein [Lasiosphaeria miniovina]|uniref:NmrA family protein n=1 Tax=Lasiosphaeria miniovina TaxID=1954250 RepID=A0AA40E7U7_9PEZI|nr:NmrA family protein [Lasiosphaeria miniovina]KAK0728317.1 NmrA family protein [Lasiosphaeria miniovina]
MAHPLKIFVVGGTGAQGLPVVRGLAADGKYAVRVLTRDPTSRRAKELVTLGPNVELLAGSFTSEADLRAGFAGCWGAFVNVDGFATGEAMEMFWTARCFEIAAESGVAMYVHGNLDYGHKLGGYDARYRCGHYDGKGRMGEWIQLQRAAAKKDGNSGGMKAAVFTTGPYIEMVLSPHTPMAPSVERDDDGDEVVTWRVPLTAGGAVPHVALDDCAAYARWLFDNPSGADGMDLAVAIDHIGYAELAAAFAKVTGRKARFVDVSLDEYWQGPYWSKAAPLQTGYTADPASPAAMTIRNNFSGFWRLWQASGGNKGVVRRDYALLDEIHPARIRSAEEFFRREDEKARAQGRGSLWDAVAVKPQFILKIHEDGMAQGPKQKI